MGGGLFVDGATSLTVDEGTFVENSALRGGEIYFQSTGFIHIHKSEFSLLGDFLGHASNGIESFRAGLGFSFYFVLIFHTQLVLF